MAGGRPMWIAVGAVVAATLTTMTGCPSYSAKTWVIADPAPLYSGGKRHLAWEVAVTNTSPGPVWLAQIDVEVDGKAAYSLRGDALMKQARPVTRGDGKKKPRKGVLWPNATAVIYLWHTFEFKDRLPLAINHRVRFEPVDDKEQPFTTNIMAQVLDLEPRSFRAPLQGQGWFTANAPKNRSRHRRSVQVGEDGRLDMSQRYAVDFVLVLGPSGTRTPGSDAKDNSSYSAYGKPVVAMADGVVLQVIDGIPENIPGKHRAVKITRDTLVGNAVLLDFGNDYYVTYAHLIPGSVAVKKGDLVKAGQVLGKIGNSGNSTEPHLHLHVCDQPSMLRCQGVPYAFDAFDEVPIIRRKGAPPQQGPSRRVQKELPSDSAWLRFPDAKP